MRIPNALSDLNESEWDALLFRNRDAVAKMLGWTSYHTLRSKGSKSGYPDRTVCRSGDRILFVELKTAKNKPTDEQVEWLDLLARAGGEVYLWKATDADFTEAGQILGRRWKFESALISGDVVLHPPRLTLDGMPMLTPRSAWVPGVGRAELLDRQLAIP